MTPRKKHNPTRRDLLKRAAYTAPVILSLQAYSAEAKAGSEKWTTEDRPRKQKKFR